MFKVVLISIFAALTVSAKAYKALDGHAVYCGQTNNLVEFPKVLKLEVLEQVKSMDTAEATIRVSLVADACENSGLDPAPRTFGTINVTKYNLTVTTKEGTLLFQQTLEKLLEASTEELTFGIPRSMAGQEDSLEIGVQIVGDVSENREMFQPYNGKFGVFLFKFD